VVRIGSILVVAVVTAINHRTFVGRVLSGVLFLPFLPVFVRVDRHCYRLLNMAFD